MADAGKDLEEAGWPYRNLDSGLWHVLGGNRGLLWSNRYRALGPFTSHPRAHVELQDSGVCPWQNTSIKWNQLRRARTTHIDIAWHLEASRTPAHAVLSTQIATPASPQAPPTDTKSTSSFLNTHIQWSPGIWRRTEAWKEHPGEKILQQPKGKAGIHEESKKNKNSNYYPLRD